MPSLFGFLKSTPELVSPGPGEEVITLAGGCFWGVELAMQRLPGVVSTCAGFTQGDTVAPTYKSVSRGFTRHAEAVRVIYNLAEVSTEEVLQRYWSLIEPWQYNRQGNDKGTMYRTGIYFHTPEQESIALTQYDQVEARLKISGRHAYTEILPATAFYPAEKRHQQYLQKGGQSAIKGDPTPIRCYGGR